jgi:hypothetical protein
VIGTDQFDIDPREPGLSVAICATDNTTYFRVQSRRKRHPDILVAKGPRAEVEDRVSWIRLNLP